MIETHGLRVVFGRTVALDGLDLRVEPGVTGLFGPNGSGKSTLIRVLAGIQRPSAGTVLLDGAPLATRDEAVRRRIGFAGHEAGLYGRLTVRENLELFAHLHGSGAGAVGRGLERLDLGPWASTPVAALSAGLTRRTAVARALLHDPDVLLLDEPYANLDDDAADLVSAAVRDWRADGRLAIVATHGGKRVKSFADAGLILRRGRVAVHGTYRAPGRAQ